MSPFSTIILAPYIIAFVFFVTRFYFREKAASIANPTFILAVTCTATVIVYLTLRILVMLPPYSTLGFGIFGVVLMALAIYRMFTV